MNKLTQEELNGLSPRARKAYEESNSVLSEITIENPNAEKEDKPKKRSANSKKQNANSKKINPKMMRLQQK